MTTQTLSNPAASTSGRLLAFAGGVVARVVKLMNALRHRRDLDILAGFDDRMLRDIGLTRGDLRDAVAQPMWRDPTDVLVRRARARRRAGRAFTIIEGLQPRETGPVAAPPLAPEIDAYSTSRFPARSRYY